MHLSGTAFANLNQRLVHIVAHTLPGVFAPLNTTEAFVKYNKAAIVALHLGVYREHLYFMTALRTDFFDDSRGLRPALTSFHNHFFFSLQIRANLIRFGKIVAEGFVTVRLLGGGVEIRPVIQAVVVHLQSISACKHLSGTYKA